MNKVEDHYFQHSFHETSRLTKIRRSHHYMGVGIYFALVEWMCSNKGIIKVDELEDVFYLLMLEEAEKEAAKDIIYNSGHFTVDGGIITCKFVDDSLDKIRVSTEQRIEAGKRSGEVRRAKTSEFKQEEAQATNTKPIPPQTQVQPKAQPQPQVPQTPQPKPQTQVQPPKTGKGRVTLDELKAYAEDSNLNYVDCSRFLKYYEKKEWKDSSEWKRELIRWNNEDKNKNRNNFVKPPEPDDGEKGSFSTGDFFQEALKKSYGEENYKLFYGNG